MPPQQGAAWLDAHRPVLEELHRVEDQLRSHAREVIRLRDDDAGTLQLQAALDTLGEDCELLGRVCTILNHCAPPPHPSAASRFRVAIDRLCGASRAETVRELVTDFEVAVAELRGVEADLGHDAAAEAGQSGT